MLGGIHAGDLLLGGYPQAVDGFDDLKYNGHGDRRVGGDGQHPKALHAQLAKPAAVEQTAISGQKAGQNRACQTTASVDRHRAHRVVDMELRIHRLYHDHHQNARDYAHHGGTQRVHTGTSGGDAHQPRQRRVQAHTHVRLAVFNPGEQHTGHGGYSRSNGGVGQDLGQLGGARRGRAVEPIPAEPQNEGTHSRQGDVVPQDRPGIALFIILADAGPQQDGPNEPRDAAYHVNDSGAGEIDETQFGQPALGIPHPTGLNGVHHSGNDSGIDAIAGEFGAFRHGSGDDGGGGSAEHQLEEEVWPVETVEIGEHLIFRHSDKAKEVVLAVHDAIAQGHEHHRADTEIH